MKTCIWCNKTEKERKFNSLAHTFPQSVGGKNICENVCDLCNYEFGKKSRFQPSVDLAVKEIFNLSRYLLDDKSYRKRFTSEYFKLDIDRKKIIIKPKYRFQHNFQENFARSFRRGIYKIFLEERERLIGDALSERFNFIREFSRYNLNDIPLYYLKPIHPILLIDKTHFNNPELKFRNKHTEIDENYRLYEFYYGGFFYILHTHNFMMDIHIKRYNENIIKNNSNLITLSNITIIHKMEDLDFRYNLFGQRKNLRANSKLSCL